MGFLRPQNGMAREVPPGLAAGSRRLVLTPAALHPPSSDCVGRGFPSDRFCTHFHVPDAADGMLQKGWLVIDIKVYKARYFSTRSARFHEIFAIHTIIHDPRSTVRRSPLVRSYTTTRETPLSSIEFCFVNSPLSFPLARLGNRLGE